MKRTIEQLVSVAERLASENGGLLPTGSWLSKNGYGGLCAAIRKHPDQFNHIERESNLAKSPTDWVAIAEQLAAEHGGVLPSKPWLRQNGKGGLYQAMTRYPEHFADVKQDSFIGKSPIQWVEVAEKLASENNGFIPTGKFLTHNGYNGLYSAMHKTPELFAHIERQTVTRSVSGIKVGAGIKFFRLDIEDMDYIDRIGVLELMEAVSLGNESADPMKAYEGTVAAINANGTATVRLSNYDEDSHYEDGLGSVRDVDFEYLFVIS